MGHWLGLRHPFEGGCSYANDLVVDTRPQRESSRRTHRDSCKPEGVRTCENLDSMSLLRPDVWDESLISRKIRGKFQLNPNSFLAESKNHDIASFDAVGNFMDYDTHACMKRFTPGQINLMQENWRFYRLHVI